MVSKGGLEPPRPCGHKHLKLARLPIPPLRLNIKSSFKAGALVGRGSGESFQMAFSGGGYVIVQPSEYVPYVPK